MKTIETQRFRNPWLWILLISVNVLFLVFGLRQVILDIPFGDKPAPDGLLAFLMAIPLLILLLFACSNLKTRFNEEQLEIRFFPFLKKQFLFSDIQSMEIITYSPFFDFGGWGIRWNIEGWAYIVSGNRGLNVKMKDGKKYLIGIQNPEKYQKLLEQFNV